MAVLWKRRQLGMSYRDSSSGSENYICCEVEYKTHTEGDKSAVLVVQNDEEVWVPRSCLSYRSDTELNRGMERGDIWQMNVARWFADKTGLEGV